MAGAVEDRRDGEGSLLDLCGVIEPEAVDELAEAIEQNRRTRSRARRKDP